LQHMAAFRPTLTVTINGDGGVGREGQQPGGAVRDSTS
jgi:hypothetical protein